MYDYVKTNTAKYKSNFFHCQINIVIVLYWQRDLSAYQSELDLVTKSQAPSFTKCFLTGVDDSFILQHFPPMQALKLTRSTLIKQILAVF